MLKVFSTFTGIGGFELGIQAAGPAELVGYSEIDKYAIQVFEHHFKEVKNYGDITKINAEELPDFDCLVGGFPCQAFSIAGRRAGFNDTRGTLFFDLARIMRAKQPRLFVFENVKGLLSHDGGRTFRTIIAAIDELGYDCQWQVLNSKNFGVPQNRERVVIVGHLRGTPRPEVFPIQRANGKDIITLNQARHDYDRVYASEGIAPAINTGQRGNAQPKIITSSPVYVDGKRTLKHTLSDEAPTIRATQYKSGDNQPKVIQRPRGKNNGGIHDIAPTLTGKSYQDNNHIISRTVRAGGRNSPHGSKQNWDSYLVDGVIRRLTPLECERLQGFPDNWTQYGRVGKRDISLKMPDQEATPGTMEYTVLMSDTQRYKMAGNAVTTTVIQAVFERLFDKTVQGNIK